MRFSIQERVRWSDVDAAGIIFYGAYIRFFEIAETELFRSVGLQYPVLYEQLDIWLPRVHLECNFRLPAQLDDLLEVRVWPGRWGNTSLQLKFEVHTERGLMADASFTLVAVDRHSFAKVPLPVELKRRLVLVQGEGDADSQ